MVIHLATPTPPGIYAFSFSIHSDDGATPFFVNDNDGFLFTPQVRKWGGEACHAPAMQAQIPPGSEDLFICPQTPS
jgi:hypothetical protein